MTTVTVANGERLRAQGLGDIKVNIDGEDIQMTDVLYVPGLDANLLSISALNRKGLTVHFRRRRVEIGRAGKVVATSHADGKMYVLHTSHVALTSSEGEGDAKDQDDDIGERDEVEVEINDQRGSVKLLPSNPNTHQPAKDERVKRPRGRP